MIEIESIAHSFTELLPVSEINKYKWKSRVCSLKCASMQRFSVSVRQEEGALASFINAHRTAWRLCTFSLKTWTEYSNKFRRRNGPQTCLCRHRQHKIHLHCNVCRFLHQEASSSSSESMFLHQEAYSQCWNENLNYTITIVKSIDLRFLLKRRLI